MIDKFTGNYRFLSNFYPSSVTYAGRKFKSVEHAYQAAKSKDKEDHKKLAEMDKPGDAKRYGNNVKLRDDWDKVKIDIMADLISQKFIDHKDLRDKLLSTGNEELVEGNTWGNKFWGVCAGEGHNTLGKLLMALRDFIRQAIKDKKLN